MTEEPGPFDQNVNDAEVSLCVFPHLKEFLVLDMRRGLPGRPCLYTSSAPDIFSQEFYRRIEEEFSTLLRRQEQPFANLMGLPQEIEITIRERALEQMLASINGDLPDAPTPRLSILLCGPSVLTMHGHRLTEMVETLFGSDADPSLVLSATREMERLIQQERIQVEAGEQQRMRGVILGQNADFLTIWQKPQ